MTDNQIKIMLKFSLQLNNLRSVFLNKALKDDEQKVELTSTKTSFKRLTGPFHPELLLVLAPSSTALLAALCAHHSLHLTSGRLLVSIYRITPPAPTRSAIRGPEVQTLAQILIPWKCVCVC